MAGTFLFGPNGFMGPSILERDKSIICVGRRKPPNYIKNKFIKIKNMRDLNILDSYKIKNVIFAIGNSNHHVFLNKNELEVSLKFNLYPLFYALNYFSKRKISKFVCFSGALLYDEKKIKIPCKENSPINPNKNNYIFGKFLAEELVKFYIDRVPIINVRLSNIYGHSILERPDLILSIFTKILKKKKVSVWSKKPKRDFIHVYDVADAIKKLCKSNFTGTINIGSGKMTSVNEVTEIIEEITNYIIHDKNIKVTGPMKYCANISLLKKITKWKPKINLRDGLQDVWSKIRLLNKKK